MDEFHRGSTKIITNTEAGGLLNDRLSFPPKEVNENSDTYFIFIISNYIKPEYLEAYTAHAALMRSRSLASSLD